jgi:hypothetical protein
VEDDDRQSGKLVPSEGEGEREREREREMMDDTRREK